MSDVERAIGFYAGVLGLALLRRVPGADGAPCAAWLRAGECVLMLERGLRGRGAESGSSHLLALSVDDLEAWRRRLEAAGIEIDDRSAHTLYVRDPDGQRVGLSDYVFG